MIDYECTILSKDGLSQNKWNSKSRTHEEVPLEEMTVLRHLRDICIIKSGTTLLDIMSFVERNDLLKVIIAEYSWCSHIDKFHAQVHEERASKPDPDDKMDCLEIYWHGSYYKQAFDIDTGFHGINSLGDKVTYSVSYSPMSDLAHLPVTLNDRCQILGKNREVLFDGKKHFTLLEVLDAIYWDISFMGGPEDNSAFLEEMNDRVESIVTGDAKFLTCGEADTVQKIIFGDENDGS